MSKEKEILIVEGMTCTNCAQGIKKHLEKKGLKNVSADFASGEVIFDSKGSISDQEIKETIEDIGYKVVSGIKEEKKRPTVEKLFLWTLPFTVPLFLHMFLPFAFLHNSLVQLILCLPVIIIGVTYFGKSAWGSLKMGVPNMDVLIFIGSTSSFIYSLAGSLLYYGSHEAHNYLFFETAATIITLVLLGNVMEHRAVTHTTTALKELNELQQLIAKKIVLRDGKEVVLEIAFKDIKMGDLLQVNTGDKIPTDGKIISGEGSINESMLSGESIPLFKRKGDVVFGSTILEDGSIRLMATKVGSETVLSQIIRLIKEAQQNPPEIQKLGDKVSAVFVPVVLGISLITFLLSIFIREIGIQQSIMNAIAVLVISCPCAMGLATPTAVMSGLGRAAKLGIIIKGGNTLEVFANTKTMVFDKTGTLTTGQFKIQKITTYSNDVTTEKVTDLIYNAEKNSSHPIAKSLVTELKEQAHKIDIEDFKEIKGEGLSFKFEQRDWFLGSSREIKTAKNHNLYLFRNSELIAGIDIKDEIKSDVKETLSHLNAQGVKTVLLSGDKNIIVKNFAKEAGIEEAFGEQLPDQKLQKIEELNTEGITAMIGDGINDAPAMAKASIGISLGNATQIAIETAQIVSFNQNQIKSVAMAYQLSKATLSTIKQNLFWAFFYNSIAIPIAAMGYLNPMVAALAMAFSDVIVIGNSIRLKFKRIKLLDA